MSGVFFQRIGQFSNINQCHLKSAYISLERTLLQQTRETELVDAFDEKMLPQMQDDDLQTQILHDPSGSYIF